MTLPTRHNAPLWEDLRNFRTIAGRSGWRAFADDLLFRLAGAPDRLPLPSPFLITLVSNYVDSRRYFERGRVHASGMFDSLRAAGARPQAFTDVLDWGCGTCGG